jgi:lysozyme
VKPSDACIELVKEFESFQPKAYLCPAGVWTVGYGTTEHVQPGDVVTQLEASELLRSDVQEAAAAVDDLVDVELTQNQYDALCSLIYNIGREAFKNSTLLKLLNAGKSAKDVGPQFDRWNKGGGRVLAGLVKRRAVERDLFES